MAASTWRLLESFRVRQALSWTRLGGDHGVVTSVPALRVILRRRGRAHFANPAKDAAPASSSARTKPGKPRSDDWRRWYHRPRWRVKKRVHPNVRLQAGEYPRKAGPPAQDKNGNVTIHLTENVRNPFQPAGQGIMANVNITISQSGAFATVSGTLSGSPSFELNVSSQTGPTVNIPVAGSSPSQFRFPILLETQRSVDVTGSVP